MASALSFEVSLPGLVTLSPANVTFMELADPAGSFFPAPPPFAPSASNMFVQTDQPLQVNFSWTASGAIFSFLTGTWNCAVFLELLGGGGVNPAPATGTTAVVTAFNNAYNVDVNLPAITAPGLYRVVATITLQGPTAIMLPIAGFTDIGILQVYEAF